jgi:MerR-like DNA binding protein
MVLAWAVVISKPIMLIITQEAARLIGVTPATINYYRRTHRLPTVELLGRPVFNREDVEKLAQIRGPGFKPPGRPKRG